MGKPKYGLQVVYYFERPISSKNASNYNSEGNRHILHTRE